MNKPPLPFRSPLLRDYDLEGVPLGPSTRMVVLEADHEGGLYYQFGRREAQSLQLPRRYALAQLALLDMSRCAAVLDPKTNRLEALALTIGNERRLVLFQEYWGNWLDDRQTVHPEADLPYLLRQWNAPLFLDEAKTQIGFDFPINIYQREIYPRETLLCFREGAVRHVLELIFTYPSGQFRVAHLRLEDQHSHRVQYIFEIEQFPLIWPPLVSSLGEVERPAPTARPVVPTPPPHPAPGNHQAGAGAGNHRGETNHRNGMTSPATRPAGAAGAAPRPAPAGPPADGASRKYSSAFGSPPAERTVCLSTHAVLGILAAESDSERRWAIIEANLALERPERTYPLILNHTELIAERVLAWPPERIKTTFAQQPGAVLMAVMQDWPVNLVLAVCEVNAESALIMEWLRERELERLLRLDLNKEPGSVESARRALRVDQHADEAVIKRTWRTLLSFMNADHGRSQERAIHRKKDEIAKHLQVARNFLLKNI